MCSDVYNNFYAQHNRKKRGRKKCGKKKALLQNGNLHLALFCIGPSICRCSLTLILTHGTARFNSCVQSTILHKCTSIMCALCMPCHVTCLGIFVVCFPSTHTHSRHGQVQFLCAVDNIYINVRVLCALCMPCHLCMSSCFPSTIHHTQGQVQLLCAVAS